MTCIVYRDGVLVGDGRETIIEDDESPIIISDTDVKVFKLDNGRLFGASKTSESCIRLRESLVKGFSPPKLEDINGLLIDKKNRIWFFEGSLWYHLKRKYYAIGSGARFALPALHAGATALEACKIGIRCDPYSGGKITIVRRTVKRQQPKKRD